MRTSALLLLVLALGTSGCGKKEDCEEIQKDIDDAERIRGLSRGTGCSSTNPQIRKDFDGACAKLKECRENE